MQQAHGLLSVGLFYSDPVGCLPEQGDVQFNAVYSQVHMAGSTRVSRLISVG